MEKLIIKVISEKIKQEKKLEELYSVLLIWWEMAEANPMDLEELKSLKHTYKQFNFTKLTIKDTAHKQNTMP